MDKGNITQNKTGTASREMETLRKSQKEMLTTLLYYTCKCEDQSEIEQLGNHIPVILHTPLFLVNSLRYFVYQIYFLAKHFNKVIHFHELLWAAFYSSH